MVDFIIGLLTGASAVAVAGWMHLRNQDEANVEMLRAIRLVAEDMAASSKRCARCDAEMEDTGHAGGGGHG